MPPQGQIGHKQRPLRTFPQGKRESPPLLQGSVEAYWLPLTPEHGFPSLFAPAGTGPGRSPFACHSPASPNCPVGGLLFSKRWWIDPVANGQKKGPPPPGEPEQIFLLYRALRRHDPDQVTQVEATTSSQPAKRTPCLSAFSVIPRRLVVKGEFSLRFGGRKPKGQPPVAG